MTSSEENNLIDLRIRQILSQYLKSQGFTDRKITDTPTEGLMVVNRNYVTNHGTVRPVSSVIGQPFIDTSLATGHGKPIWWNGTGWIDATGAYV